MSKTEVRMYAWGKFFADVDDAELHKWLTIIGEEAKKHFTKGVRSQHTGRVGYRKGGGRFIRSAPGEYPAEDSGRLLASTKMRVTRTTVVIGTDVFYAKFLTEGTRMMEKRKMYREALAEGIAAAADNLHVFARWKGVSRWKSP